MTDSSFMSISWYFSDDEPALMTRIFICFLSPMRNGRRARRLRGAGADWLVSPAPARR